MRHRISIVVLIVLLIGGVLFKQVLADTINTTFYVGSTIMNVNGFNIIMDAAPYISNNRTFVPVRYLADGLDATTSWDESTLTITITKGDKTVILVIGSKIAKVNGANVVMDVAPEIKNGRTMLPARYIAETLGYDVKWDSALYMLSITPTNEYMEGTIYWNGGTYTGGHINGIPDGFGTHKTDTFTYVGPFRNGLPHGQGTLKFISGDLYIGHFENGVRAGTGKYIWPNGNVYEGEWKNNKREGFGKLSTVTGTIYQGNWVNDYENGPGKLIGADGSVLTITWVKGVPSGMGTYLTNDGRTLTVMFNNGVPTLLPFSSELTIIPPELSNTLMLIADDGKATYLGKLTTNRFDLDSVFNEYGIYGSEFSINSIWNKFGTYGSEYSIYSVFCK